MLNCYIRNTNTLYIKTQKGLEMIRLTFFLLTIIVSGGALSAPKYIELKPLEQLINTPVGNVSNSPKLQVPIITWGGDMATIYGNGNQRSTAAGSIFSQHKLNFKLVREDVFLNQVKNYISGKTPYLRGTLGMINSAGNLLSKSNKTKPVIFYQMTWSAGGDALVVKQNIKKVSDLKGKTVALQAYGPHVDYLVRVLSDAGLTIKDIKIKWLADLTGTDNTPMAAFYEKDIDAAFVIIPDALALTSGGNVGTGSEDSVSGSRILMSTKTANRVIADVYAVRSDYYDTHKSEVHNFAKALMVSEEALSKLVANRSAELAKYKKTMSAAAEILLDSPEAIADTEGLYADCEFVHFSGNVKFFTDNNYPRRIDKVSQEINKGLSQFGLIKGNNKLIKASINYNALKAGLSQTVDSNKSRFKKEKVSALITRKQQQNSLQDGELFSFEVYFKPNQKIFSADLYKNDFEKVVDLASTYGGAIISVEGHSDPMGYLRGKKKGQPSVVLGRIKQSAKNLSLSRSQAVRDEIITYARNKGISMDLGQFATVGHGIAQPNTGICGEDPCAPKNQSEWKSNMRVQFRIIQVEAESEVFISL